MWNYEGGRTVAATTRLSAAFRKTLGPNSAGIGLWECTTGSAGLELEDMAEIYKLWLWSVRIITSVLIADQCRNHGKWDEQGRVVMFVVYMQHFFVEERQIRYSRWQSISPLTWIFFPDSLSFFSQFLSGFVRSAFTRTKSCMFPVCLVLLKNNVETLQSLM